jgi:hypothetical protein
VILWDRPRRSSNGRKLGVEKSPRKRINGQGFVGGESRNPADRQIWRSCEGVNSRRTKNQAIAYRHSAFDEARFRLVEIASRDFPSYSGPSIRAGTGGTRSQESENRGSAFGVFDLKGKLASWIRDP